ncbi:MAG: RtcB family protein [Candidatus Chisholmbacteria bacterium]|nr:RtcB family protein [Candidatus Chisholmbacteria bacterium]
MKAEAVFYASEKLLPLLTRDQSLKQLQQTAELPYLMSPVLGMPDMHEGYGIPVGGIMASSKIVSAGCVGMDINCGVRLLKTGVKYEPRVFDERGRRELVKVIEAVIPIGLGGEYRREHPGLDLEKVIVDGARYLVEVGYGKPADLEVCEEEGAISGANPDKISRRAVERAKKQIGTLGSGNHFLELQRVTEIFDEKIAAVFGLEKDLMCLMIHSGSRALGHQTCIDYVERFYRENRGELAPTHDLASALVDSQVGQDYIAAMQGAINFAFANRQMMTHQFRKTFEDFAKKRRVKADVQVVYDVAHNSAKLEEHRGEKVWVHRKGATRALPPGHPENPPVYQQTGHPALVPGSMGTGSYVLVGTGAAAETYFSVNHGAGRAMSRKEAKQTISKQNFLNQVGGVVVNQPYQKVVDEAPQAYKNVDEVIETLVEIGITRKVAKLEPLAVIKGD